MEEEGDYVCLEEVIPPAIGGDDPPDLGDHSSPQADSAPPDELPAIGGAQIVGGSDRDDHSLPQADAAPPVPGRMPSTMEELAVLNEIESWQNFQTLVASSLS